MTCAYFVSDLHLTDLHEPKARVFLRFLESLRKEASAEGAERPTHLFLVGDVFDLWIGSHSYFVSRFESIVTAVAELVKAGVAVHFFEGNHDLHLRPFWQDEIGARVYSEAAFFALAGRTVRVEHGDLMNPQDRGYLFLRKLLRTPVIRTVSLNLPSQVVAAIGDRASGVSRQYTSTAKSLDESSIRALIRRHAERVFAEKPFDLLISGHVHVVDDVTFQADGRSVRSVNLGSWFDKPRAFRLSDRSARFIELA